MVICEIIRLAEVVLTFLSLAVSMILYKLDEEPHDLSLVFIYARLCPLYLEYIPTRAIYYYRCKYSCPHDPLDHLVKQVLSQYSIENFFWYHQEL